MEQNQETGHEIPVENLTLAVSDEDNVHSITLLNLSEWINDMTHKMFSNVLVTEINLSPESPIAYLFPFSKEEAMHLGEEAGEEYIKDKVTLVKEYISQECERLNIDENLKAAICWQIDELLYDMIINPE